MTRPSGSLLPATGRTSRALGLALALVVGCVASLGAIAPAGAEAAQPRVPRPGCVPGATPEERLTNVVGVLLGVVDAADYLVWRSAVAEDATGSADGGPPSRCAGARVLSYLEQDALWLDLGLPVSSRDGVYLGFTEGTSLADAFAELGVDRSSLLDGLSNTYLQAADSALADGAIDERQQGPLSILVFDLFAWLVDWEPGASPVRVAAGDVNGDDRVDVFAPDPGAAGPGSIDQLFACVGGATSDERINGIVAILIGLVAGPDLADASGNRLADHPVCDDVAFILARFESPLPDLLGLTPAEIQDAYAAGSSLAELGEERGMGPDADLIVMVALIDVWEHAYSLAAAAGDLGEVDAAAIDGGAGGAHPDLYRLIHHRRGEPLKPVDPFGVF